MERVTLSVSVPTFKDLTWETEVGFFYEDWGMPFSGLLGQEGFLDRWVVSFDYPRSFVMEEKDDFRDRMPVLSPEEVENIWEWQELGWKGKPGSR